MPASLIPLSAAVLGVFFAAAYTLFTRFGYQRAQRPAQITLGLTLLAGAVFAATGVGASIFVALMLTFGCVFAIGAAVQARRRYREVCRWRDDPRAALLLESPFAEPSMVVVGGPFSQRNHHTTIPSERFAYDIVVADGESLGQPVLAPVAGVVEDVRATMVDARMRTFGRDGHGVEWRFGNFVSIRVGDLRVLCCHLRHDSVCVMPGQTVVAGEPIGDCGNSGRSFAVHLHIHAQDRPARVRGEGVPIAFRRGDVATVPLPGDILQAAAAAPPGALGFDAARNAISDARAWQRSARTANCPAVRLE